MSCSGVSVPACPPARLFTQMSPSTPASLAFSAQRRAVTSWYTVPPTWCTFSTTHEGLPRAVTKNRTPSSSATSIHWRIRFS